MTKNQRKRFKYTKLSLEQLEDIKGSLDEDESLSNIVKVVQIANEKGYKAFLRYCGGKKGFNWNKYAMLLSHLSKLEGGRIGFHAQH